MRNEEKAMEIFNDRLVAKAMTECKHKIKHLSTMNALRTSYLMLNHYFRLCCVCGNKKDLKDLAKEMYDDLLKEIDEIASADE